jgi:hypothetical protein
MLFHNPVIQGSLLIHAEGINKKDRGLLQKVIVLSCSRKLQFACFFRFNVLLTWSKACRYQLEIVEEAHPVG